MQLEFEDFEKVRKTVERIIADFNIDIQKELDESGKDIPKEGKRPFYSHMNALFLNVILNRLDELGPKVEPRAFEARKKIVEIINTL
ncbi:hypothetical protein EZS27_004756 [termite gut metagenome]|jgi:hypothetical protein|uniref:Uncharacterized protein n=1 Tax=termite gut metagenome TaxID=433724 RepID=A0A5J4SR07_9ZZZZ